MAEGVKQKIGERFEQAKSKVGPNGPPVATDAEGRVGVVQSALRAFGEGDADGFFEHLHEDVDWEAPGAKHFPGGGTWEGRDEIRKKYLGDAERTYGSFGFRPETYLESEDHDQVIVIGTYEGQGVKAAEPLSVPAVQIWEFDRGQVLKIRIITDSAAMPEVITEEDEEEEQEEERKKQEESENKDKDSGDDEGEDEDKDGEDSGSGDDSASKSKSGTGDQPDSSREEDEQENDGGAEASDDEGGDAESKSEPGSDAEARLNDDSKDEDSKQES